MKKPRITLLTGVQCETKYLTEVVSLQVARYSNGRIALQTYTADGEPFMTCSVNVPDQPCGESEVYIKNYSENEGITKWLLAQAILVWPPVGRVHSGHTFIERYALSKPIAERIAKELQ